MKGWLQKLLAFLFIALIFSELMRKRAAVDGKGFHEQRFHDKVDLLVYKSLLCTACRAAYTKGSGSDIIAPEKGKGKKNGIQSHAVVPQD